MDIRNKVSYLSEVYQATRGYGYSTAIARGLFLADSAVVVTSTPQAAKHLEGLINGPMGNIRLITPDVLFGNKLRASRTPVVLDNSYIIQLLSEVEEGFYKADVRLKEKSEEISDLKKELGKNEELLTQVRNTLISQIKRSDFYFAERRRLYTELTEIKNKWWYKAFTNIENFTTKIKNLF